MDSAALVPDPLGVIQIAIFSMEVSTSLSDNYPCHLWPALLLVTLIIISLSLEVLNFRMIFLLSRAAGTEKIPTRYLNKFNLMHQEGKENYFLYLSKVIFCCSEDLENLIKSRQTTTLCYSLPHFPG